MLCHSLQQRHAHMHPGCVAQQPVTSFIRNERAHLLAEGCGSAPDSCICCCSCCWLALACCCRHATPACSCSTRPDSCSIDGGAAAGSSDGTAAELLEYSPCVLAWGNDCHCSCGSPSQLCCSRCLGMNGLAAAHGTCAWPGCMNRPEGCAWVQVCWGPAGDATAQTRWLPPAKAPMARSGVQWQLS